MRLFISTCALLTIAVLPAFADYKISSGDTLNLTIAGLADLTTKAPVDLDGSASFPLIGQLRVAGMSLAEARAKIQAVLPNQEFRRRTEDGREFPVIISPSDINLSILEYRPVYINGDVAKPGQEAYRPGLTVRQAIALAGGYDILRFKMDNPFLELSDLTGLYKSLWIDYAKQQAEIARLNAELGGKADLERGAMIDAPIDTSLNRAFLDNQRQQLASKNADFAKERTYLENASAQEGERARLLTEQEAKETEGVKSDSADLQRYEDLFKKGAVALPNLSEARRTVLLSSTRALQTTALLASVQREQGDLTRKADRLGDTRRIQVLHDLDEANAQLATLRTKLQTVSEKLRYTGMVKSQLVRGGDSQPKITVVRVLDGKSTQAPVNIDAELQPGDVVEVALQAEQPLGVSQ